jgi:clan AA aspartic protease
MLTGTVTADREAIKPFRLQGTNGREADINAVIDTGFTEALTLPQALMSALALVQVSSEEMVLADGTCVQAAVYEMTVVWGGQSQSVFAHSMQGSPLIGMSLLSDHLLTVHVQEGGPATIAPIP